MIKKTVTHLTSAHQRYDTRIFLKECSSLAKEEDYQVSLVVADGEGDEVKNGVNIVDAGEKTGGRLSRMTGTVKKVFEKAKELDNDIYHFHDPELIPIGVKLKKMGKIVIYDIHEITHQQIMQKDWLPYALRYFVSKSFKLYEGRACKKFDCLLVPQPMMVEMFNAYGKTETICNFVSSEHFSKRKPKEKSNDFIAMHAGGLSEHRGLYNMLNAFSSISNAKLFLAGPVNNADLAKIQETKNVSYKGFLSVEEVNKLYDESDIGVILYNNVGQYYLSFSIKLFEYMLKGLPIIMPDFGEWIGFNEKYQCGINVDVTNPEEVRNAIVSLSNDSGLYDRLSQNGMSAAEENFTWESQEKKLFQIYKELLDD